MNSDVPTSKAHLPENITHILENLLGCDLEDTLAAISSDPAEIETFLAKLPTDNPRKIPHTTVGRACCR